MLTPTHIQVAILRTKNLIIKGKNGTNDAFVVFGMGKEKYQSSVKEKVSNAILEWSEGCDIAIPTSLGNKAELVLKVLHKASIGEKFLGRVAISLSQFDITATPKPIWYPLKPKVGSEKDTKNRGEIEVKVTFLIKTNPDGSTADLKSKRKDSTSIRSSIGSLLSLGKKKKKDKSDSSKESINGSVDSMKNVNSSRLNLNNNLPIINDDPGVISEEEEEDGIQFNSQKFDSKTGSKNSVVSGSMSETLNSSASSTPKNKSKGFRGIFNTPGASMDKGLDEEGMAVPKPRTVRLPSVIVEEPPSITLTTPQPPSKGQNKLTVSASMSNLVDTGGKGTMKKSIRSLFTPSKHLSVDELYDPTGHSHEQQSSPKISRTPSLRDLKIPKETYKQYERKSKEELIVMILNLQGTAGTQKQKISDLEDYIDKLLLRVLDNMPLLLKKGNSVRGNGN